MALPSAASSVKLFSIAKTAATCRSPASLYAATNSSVHQTRLASGGKYPKCAVQDCQKSIFVDLVACAVISADAVRRDRGPTTAAIFCLASLVFSPGAAVAFFLALRAAAANGVELRCAAQN